MILNESKKQKHFCFKSNFVLIWLQEMYYLLNIGETYNHDLLKVSKITVTDNFNSPKLKKMTKVTGQSDWENTHKSLKN